MNADHIVVIMDGQVVEQGSHDELFHSQGKYADLWAKQIFVKPSDKTSRSRSESPAKNVATIINDLTSQDKTIDLAEAAKETKDPNHSHNDGHDFENGTTANDQSKDVSDGSK